LPSAEDFVAQEGSVNSWRMSMSAATDPGWEFVFDSPVDHGRRQCNAARHCRGGCRLRVFRQAHPRARPLGSTRTPAISKIKLVQGNVGIHGFAADEFATLVGPDGFGLQVDMNAIFYHPSYNHSLQVAVSAAWLGMEEHGQPDDLL
jgi:hypothetical protein